MRNRALTPVRSGAGAKVTTVIVSALLAALSVGCGGASRASNTAHRRAASAVAPLSGHIYLTFSDTATRKGCPRRTPARDECFVLTATSQIPHHGTIRLGPAIDIEAPSSSGRCGSPITVPDRLTSTEGILDVSERGPRLCLGAVGNVSRRFRVTGGTGRYLGATGAGNVTIDVEPVGAFETWSGSITLRTG